MHALRATDGLSINFRELVKACAIDPETVAEFNQLYGTDLKCPIAALVEPLLPDDLTDDEMVQLAWFVAWVDHYHRPRLRAAGSNIEKLKSFYEEKLKP